MPLVKSITIVRAALILLPAVSSFGCKSSPEQIRDAMKPFVKQCVATDQNPTKNMLLLRDLRQTREHYIPQGKSTYGNLELKLRVDGSYDADFNGASFSQIRTCALAEAFPHLELPKLSHLNLPGRE